MRKIVLIAAFLGAALPSRGSPRRKAKPTRAAGAADRRLSSGRQRRRVARLVAPHLSQSLRSRWWSTTRRRLGQHRHRLGRARSPTATRSSSTPFPLSRTSISTARCLTTRSPISRRLPLSSSPRCWSCTLLFRALGGRAAASSREPSPALNYFGRGRRTNPHIAGELFTCWEVENVQQGDASPRGIGLPWAPRAAAGQLSHSARDSTGARRASRAAAQVRDGDRGSGSDPDTNSHWHRRPRQDCPARFAATRPSMLKSSPAMRVGAGARGR